MALVNIPRTKDDPNYRYKMPKIISKVEGRGNGTRTNISNMGDIARALKRPPMYPTKFFGCELGAMAKFEEAEEKALVNGSHNEADLITILDKFIEMYVLCAGCELPEIDMIVKKGVLSCKCNACGYQGSLDMQHKAATYMIRNPPDSGSSTMGKKKKSKEERRVEKLEKQRSKEKDVNGEEVKPDKTKKSKKKKSEEGDADDDDCDESRCKSVENSGDATPTNEGESDTWDEEKNDDDKKKKKKDKKKKAEEKDEEKTLMHKDVLVFDSPEIGEVAERLQTMLSEKKEVDVDFFYQELRVLQVSQDFDAKCRLYITFCALFNDGLTPSILESKIAFLSKICDSSVRADDVLEALEYYCCNDRPSALTSFPYLIQKLYNADVLEADEILRYYKKDSDNSCFTKCKKLAEPFLEWLKEEDASSDEDDGDSPSSLNVAASKVQTKSLKA